MKVPSFKPKKVRVDVLEMLDIAPTRGMYKIVMMCIDAAMDDLSSVREEIISDKKSVKDSLKKWDEAYAAFGEREAFYYDAVLNSEDRSVLDSPLFKGDYGGFDFKSPPNWPDMETPWRLANDLSTIAVAAGADQSFMNEIGRMFKNVIIDFWQRANSMIVFKKTSFEEAAAAEAAPPSEGEGVVFGFWPIVAVGAASVAAALAAAAGYSAASSSDPDKYVAETKFEKHLKTAKTAGVGILAGVAIAVLLMLRIRTDR